MIDGIAIDLDRHVVAIREVRDAVVVGVAVGDGSELAGKESFDRFVARVDVRQR
ncbi:MAG: hypothetical protein H0W72_13720 [Planctomycetes bacterium]|nr:hypothetical protein [Planctomycetota bacterium]